MFLFVGLMLLGLYFGKNENITGEKSAEKKSEMSISYEFTGKRPDFSLNEDEISEEKYYESVEEHYRMVYGEGEEYVSIFYRAVKDKI